MICLTCNMPEELCTCASNAMVSEGSPPSPTINPLETVNKMLVEIDHIRAILLELRDMWGSRNG